MGNSTRASARRKQAADRPDWRRSLGLHPSFPLFRHQNGRWAKKVRQKLHYFGKIGTDPMGKAALDEWLRVKDDLLAGRMPRPKDAQGVTVAELCDRFLQCKDNAEAAGDITRLTRIFYGRTCDRLVAFWGKTRLVSDLANDDFEQLRASIATTNGPVSLGNEVTRVRVVFKYGYESGLLDHPMRYGPTFKKSSKKVMRLARAAKGQRMIEAGDLRRIIEAADVHMRAMIYLALNAGYGNSDCGCVPVAAVNLESGWIEFPRPKTGVGRRCPLWPETVAAIKVSLDKRPRAKHPDAAPLMFVTKYGASWAKDAIDNPITKAFRKLLDKLKLHQRGLGFYTLRHVFRTIADHSLDQVAVNSIMGHADASMAAAYRERIDDSRLLAVCDHVHAWLFPDAVEQPKAMKRAKPKPRRSGRDPVTAGPQLRVVG